MGREEFVVLLNEISPGQAYSVAESLRTRIQLEIFNSGNARFQVTSSFGIALIGSGCCFSSAFTKRDNALYQAKDKGCNRVEGNISKRIESNRACA
ncbi:MAG: diguanylate cyclase domain-containing protein [Henriciella sp.]